MSAEQTTSVIVLSIFVGIVIAIWTLVFLPLGIRQAIWAVITVGLSSTCGTMKERWFPKSVVGVRKE